jgi:hypothetical protein
MATYISTSSSWFYDKASEVLFINEEGKKVGILTDTPEVELDVRGALSATTYCNLPAFALSNQIYPVATFGSNTARDTSNLLNSNFSFTTNNIQTSKKLTCSNLDVSNTLIRINGSNLIDTNKKIDYNTWIAGGPQFSNDNTLGVAGVVLGTVGIVSALGGTILKQSGMGDILKNEITDKLNGGDAETENSQPDDLDLKVHYNNITFSPLFTKVGKTEIGINSNLYISNKAKLCSITHDDLLVYDSGKTKRIVTNQEYKVVFDFSNQTLFCDSVEANYDILTRELQTSNIITSNIIATSNIITSNIITSNLISSNIQTSNCIISNTLTTSNVATSNIQSINGFQTGNHTINSNGYFINYAQPYDEFQVINRFGRYLGDIYLAQIVDIESLNLNKLKAGEVALDNYTINNNSLFETTMTAFDSVFDF